jgi:hypothetical protein
MKQLHILLMFLFFDYTVAFAQAPQKMSFQAVIRDNNNNELITSSTVGMKISILRGSKTGYVVYSERQIQTTNINGLVNLEIGRGSVLSGSFVSIDWANGPYFIKTETDRAGGTSYSITSSSEIMSVPYAMFSASGVAGPTGPTGTQGLQGPPGSAGLAHYVGELYGGGIVFAVWKENGTERGLVASLKDISSAAPWSNITSTLIGASAQSPTDGMSNTNAIIAQSGNATIAAKLCKDYSGGGFNDWYLPAAWELNQCYNSVSILNRVLGVANGFYFGYYLNSNEDTFDSAWGQNFLSGAMGGVPKSDPKHVRAVRRF